MLAALLLAQSFAWALPPADSIELGGFLADGRPVALLTRTAGETGHGEKQKIAVVTGEGGAIARSCRAGHDLEEGDPRLGDSDGLWAHAAADCSWAPDGAGRAIDLKPGQPATALPEVFPLVVESRGCGLRLSSAAGGARIALLEHACERGESAKLTLATSVEEALSPDRRSLALVWHVLRFRNVAGSDVKFERLHPALVPLRRAAAIELLDAGAGPALAAARSALEKAGFVVAAQGPAQKPRGASAIFAARGAETVAADAAAALGLAAAVEPLDWRARGAVVIALAGK